MPTTGVLCVATAGGRWPKGLCKTPRAPRFSAFYAPRQWGPNSLHHLKRWWVLAIKGKEEVQVTQSVKSLRGCSSRNFWGKSIYWMQIDQNAVSYFTSLRIRPPTVWGTPAIPPSKDETYVHLKCSHSTRQSGQATIMPISHQVKISPKLEVCPYNHFCTDGWGCYSLRGVLFLHGHFLFYLLANDLWLCQNITKHCMVNLPRTIAHDSILITSNQQIDTNRILCPQQDSLNSQHLHMQPLPLQILTSSSYQDTCALHVDDARFHAIHRLSGQTRHGAACHGTSKVQTQIVGKASLQCLAFPSLRGCAFSNVAFEMVKLYRFWYSANMGCRDSFVAATETKALETKATMFPGQILDLGIHCHLKLQIQFDRLRHYLLMIWDSNSSSKQCPFLSWLDWFSAG